jgi:hypothetical protein
MIIKILRFAVLAVPIAIWLIHIVIILPIISAKSGDDTFITAASFFSIAAALMIVCLLISISLYVRNRTWRNFTPILLNLTWIYYVKVVLLGPTIGYL